MTIQELDLLKVLNQHTFKTQRALAEFIGCALGTVNKALHLLDKNGYITAEDADNLNEKDFTLTPKAKNLLAFSSPHNAIILAAGFGMRMVPINTENPKGLLKVHGERLIERIIQQLHEAGVTEIHIVVGFMKEKFEYLIDKYGVDLIVNPEYAKSNNIESLARASQYLGNTYIIPSDVWCGRNPFNRTEAYSWYMVSDFIDDDSDVRVNRKSELVRVKNGASGNDMIGISYLCGKEAEVVRHKIALLRNNPAYTDKFWEEALYNGNRMIVNAKVVDAATCVEINTYEQLRDFDQESDQLKSEAISTITSVFKCRNSDVTEIKVLKKGMTNRSFLFKVDNCHASKLTPGKYIMRIPGEGTEHLINRAQEARVYQAIKDAKLCDAPVYINAVNGFKITQYLENVRVCNPFDEKDLAQCMMKLRTLHDQRIQVGHSFDIFGHINFYQSLWKIPESMYGDHEKTTSNIFTLKKYIDAQPKDNCLTHIDAVYDNFLFYTDKDGKEKLQLTDWEYAGMQDPHVDIAMFCIYALYDKSQADRLIDIYFQGKCDETVRTKIYCYMAACGLLWSNWCEYKSQLGVEFGEYSLRQYRFAKDYYRYAVERMS